MIEIKSQRSARGACYDNGDGTRTYRAHLGDHHYYNHDARGDGEIGWRKCDIQWLGSGPWTCEYGPFRAVAPLTADGAVAFTNLRSDGQKHASCAMQSVATGVQPVAGVVDGPRIVYADAYGAGTDLILELRASGVARLIRVRAGYTAQPQFVFEFSAPSAKLVRLTQNPYEIDARGPKKVDKQALTAVMLGDDSTFIRPFMAWDGERSGVIGATLALTQGGFTLTKESPIWWGGATDLYIDDSTSVNSSANDGSLYNIDNVASSGANWTTCRTAANADGVDGSGATLLNVQAHYKNSVTTGYRIQRIYLDLILALGPVASIDAVVLNAYLVAVGPFNDAMHVIPSAHALPPVVGDFYSALTYTEYAVRAMSTGDTLNAYKTFTFNSTGRSAVNANGTNKYALVMGDDFDNSSPGTSVSSTAAWQWNSSGAASNKPYFDVTYTPAPSGDNQRFMMMGVG